jgi:Ca-activated chloride channel homolog
MNFLSPWNFLWLAPLGAIILFLYLLKLKRAPRPVSSLLLWSRLAADLQANAPFQKLKRNLLLLLQLLVLLALIAALARPFLRVTGLEGQYLVVILDASASMKSEDLRGSRFGAAQAAAIKAVNALGRNDQMALLEAAAKTRVITPFTSDRKMLEAEIAALQCSDAVTNLEDALRLADSLCARKRNAQILVLSDGAFPPLPGASLARAKLTFLPIGKRADNLAITALGSRKPPVGGDQQIFVALQNFSDEAKSFVIELYRESTLFDAREMSLSPGGKGGQIFSLPRESSGLITARLDARDDLTSDNSASLFLTQSRPISVLLISKGDLFLERALLLEPNLNVIKAAAPPSGDKTYDLVIVEGINAPRLPRARGYLYINSAGPAAPVTTAGALAAPEIVDWDQNDPVTRYVDFTGLRIAEAKRAALKSWGRPLADIQGGPLIAAGQQKDYRSLYLGWDLLNSDFPLRVAFPIFLTNALEWLTQTASSEGLNTATPGEVVTLPPPAETEKLKLVYPSGKSAEFTARPPALLIEDTESVGVYRVEGKHYRQRFAINLLSREESNTRPREQISLAGRKISGSALVPKTNRELWRSLVLLALAIITLEWFVFHRRP